MILLSEVSCLFGLISLYTRSYDDTILPSLKSEPSRFRYGSCQIIPLVIRSFAISWRLVYPKEHIDTSTSIVKNIIIHPWIQSYLIWVPELLIKLRQILLDLCNQILNYCPIDNWFIPLAWQAYVHLCIVNIPKMVSSHWWSAQTLVARKPWNSYRKYFFRFC